jgi:maltooligosyltrehalose trehalohydrolase
VTEVGALYRQDGSCVFVLWGPKADRVEIELPEAGLSIPMAKDPQGYHRAAIENINLPAKYFYKVGDKRLPDPASHFQPDGVHGASKVVNHFVYSWSDSNWQGIGLEEMIIYELHVAAFTNEGTFKGVEARLDELKELGITAIELMPVAQFPGTRNWGYDGAYPFAVQNSYGGPEGLKHLVDVCHQKGLVVILDVVYNHFGPEGAYIGQFGPYFTDKYKTPWGMAINFDDAYSDDVRNFFIENALHWFRNYHIDALRLDAVHAIYDFSAKPFLQELAEHVSQFSLETGRKYYLIAESDLNDVRLIRPSALGGFGLDAQWSDDFHHSLHTLLTGESQGYYQSFGKLKHFAKAFKEGFVYEWDYSTYRKRHFGSSAARISGAQFVVCSQNHDQVGNRMLGERLSQLVSFEALKLAAASTILSPYIPLLFMGEEYGEKAPFLYFVDHSDPSLIEAVQKGRAQEFRDFAWQERPPDPQDIYTFERSKLRWQLRQEGKHSVLLRLYKRLIELRNEIAALKHLDKESLSVSADSKKKLIEIRRWNGPSQVLILLNFKSENIEANSSAAGRWIKILDSAEQEWLGPGALSQQRILENTFITLRPLSFVLYRLEGI